jgi:DNA-binding winged helix-turn-helix (wHTH) protein
MIFELGDLMLWLHNNCAFIKGRKLHLQPMEYNILRALAMNSESYLTGIELVHIANATSKRNVQVTIFKLRKKLLQHTKSICIENMYNYGYKLAESPARLKIGYAGHKRNNLNLADFARLKDDVEISIRLLAKKHNVDVAYIKSLWTVKECKKAA